MVKQFEEKKFNIGKLVGISDKTTEEHLKLYAGYVKNANLVLEKIGEMSVDAEKNAYAISETQRRFGFEYNGMRNHEVYFDSLEGGAKAITADGELAKCLAYLWSSFDKWLAQFKSIAIDPGIAVD